MAANRGSRSILNTEIGFMNAESGDCEEEAQPKDQLSGWVMASAIIVWAAGGVLRGDSLLWILGGVGAMGAFWLIWQATHRH